MQRNIWTHIYDKNSKQVKNTEELLQIDKKKYE